MDPHAWAKIRTRESLEALERLARGIDATNAGVSRAMLDELARLKHRLSWCDSCYSRARSVKLWMWVTRAAVELLVRWMEISHCLLDAAHTATPLTYDVRNDDPVPAAVETIAAGRARRSRGYLRLLSLAA